MPEGPPKPNTVERVVSIIDAATRNGRYEEEILALLREIYSLAEVIAKDFDNQAASAQTREETEKLKEKFGIKYLSLGVGPRKVADQIIQAVCEAYPGMHKNYIFDVHF